MPEYLDIMTELGKYFIKKSVSKAAVSDRTGISRSRISELTLKENTHLRARELYLIALAVGVDPCDLLKELFKDLKLKND